MAKRLYVAYGSNLNLEQMRWRCPDAKPIGAGIITGYELLFKGSQTGSYLTIEKADGSDVPVGVFEVSEDDEQALDRYEGYPVFYYKKEMVIPIKSFKTGKVSYRKVFVYIMKEERLVGIPSKLYMNTCLEGYRYFDFDTGYLKEALERSIDRIMMGA